MIDYGKIHAGHSLLWKDKLQVDELMEMHKLINNCLLIITIAIVKYGVVMIFSRINGMLSWWQWFEIETGYMLGIQDNKCLFINLLYFVNKTASLIVFMLADDKETVAKFPFPLP